MEEFAWFKREICCTDSAYINKVAKSNNVVNYFLFERTVDAKGMKTKGTKEMVCAILTTIRKKNWTKNFWVHKEKKNLLESFTNYAKLTEWKIIEQWVRTVCICRTYNTIPEFTPYRYREDNGCKYGHKLT